MLGLSPSREISEIYLIIHAIAFRSKMKTIDIYTDGACSGNPGIGGWAALLIYNGHKKEISGYDKDTTNNRMEIFAVIQGLRALKESCIVNLYTDSSYVSDAFNKAWIAAWQKTTGAPQVKKRSKIRTSGGLCYTKLTSIRSALFTFRDTPTTNSITTATGWLAKL